MSWVTLLFWSFDMLASCLTGYISKGVTIMKPRLIIWHYLRTWFLLDLIVICPDWAFTLVAAISGTSEGNRRSKLTGALRSFRVSRMLRLVKVKRLISLITDRINSEKIFIMAKIFILILFVLVVTHFLAAMWYVMGDLNPDGVNWIDSHDLRDRSLGDRYSISYHWCLSQFTPGAMEVVPHSLHERIYNIAVLIFGLVLFSSFVSSITSSMTRLQDIGTNDSLQLWLLRRYLRQNSVSGALSWRILRHMEYAMLEQKKQVPAAKIWALQLLSGPLRLELNYAVNCSCLKAHPFFGTTEALSHETVVKLTEKALREHSFASNDYVFNAGLVSTTMHMLQSGELGYHHFIEGQININEPSEVLREQDWVCEAALWTEWQTLGTLMAMTQCKMICLHGERFTDVMQENLVVWKLCSEYAREFVSWLCDIPLGRLTDVAKAKDMVPICMDLLTRAS